MFIPLKLASIPSCLQTWLWIIKTGAGSYLLTSRQQSGVSKMLVRWCAFRVCPASNSSLTPVSGLTPVWLQLRVNCHPTGKMFLQLLKTHLYANFVLPEKSGGSLRLVLGDAAPVAQTCTGASCAWQPLSSCRQLSAG